MPEFAEAFFGALRAGLVAVPINPGYTARELRHVLADSGASVLIATAGVVRRRRGSAELPSSRMSTPWTSAAPSARGRIRS